MLGFTYFTNRGEIKMETTFSNYSVENISRCRAPASRINQEALHHIRRQGRIERAKVFRQCFAILKRLALTTAQSGRGIS